MNDHLAVVFEKILPAFDAAGVPYWVYGGVGVAGALGRYIRVNADVDIYVSEPDFGRASDLLYRIAWDQANSTRDTWATAFTVHPGTKRPKVELLVGPNWRRFRELFSMVSVYDTPKGIEFRANPPPLVLPPDAFARHERRVDGFRFITPSTATIKSILRSLLIERGSWENARSKRETDARALFTEPELAEIESQFKSR